MAFWTLGRLEEDGPAIFRVPSEGMELGLEPGREVTVRAGGLGVKAMLTGRAGRNERILWANRPGLKALRLPAGLRLGVRVASAGEDELVLGPVVGILSTRGRRSRFGSQTGIIREMTRLAATEGVLAFGFYPDDINWSKQTVRGARFAGGRWRTREFPFPDVVYNRVPGRRAERSAAVTEVTQRLQDLLGPRYFNSHFLDKWETYLALVLDSDIAPLLPETRRYHGPEGVMGMLDRYDVVFLKPTAGSQGRGIIRLLRRWPDRYAWQYQGARSMRTGEVSRGRLGRTLHRLMRKQKYLMQEGLDLARVSGRPFDVRVLMQKDQRGCWRRTKVFARVGTYGGITSNISTGGTGESLRQVVPLALRRVRPSRRRQLAAKIRETATWLSARVEEALAMPLGELGLDLGIDRRGRIWLIEVNSRPWRNVTTERGSMITVRLALTRPLAYARYLAGFSEADS